MRKAIVILALLLGCLSLKAQVYLINLHDNGSVVYSNSVNDVHQIRFEGNQPATMVMQAGCGYTAFPITAFDSITFVRQEEPPVGDRVYINYNGSNVEITNPFSNSGVSISTSGANVTVNSTQANVPFEVSGNSSNGSLTMFSSQNYELTFNNLTLASTTTSAINLASPVDVVLNLEGLSTLADAASSSINGALYAASNLAIGGTGILQVTGNAKHGISVDGNLTVNNGEIHILGTDSDGIHGSGNLTWNGGKLAIESAGSDGLDISGNVTIQNGELNINTTAESQRGIKVSGIFTMNNGSLEITHSGDMSKGIKADSDINITGGIINITSSGSTVLESVNNQNVPAYCSAIKCDTDINITGGDFTITLPSSNNGGKGKSGGKEKRRRAGRIGTSAARPSAGKYRNRRRRAGRIPRGREEGSCADRGPDPADLPDGGRHAGRIYAPRGGDPEKCGSGGKSPGARQSRYRAYPAGDHRRRGMRRGKAPAHDGSESSGDVPRASRPDGCAAGEKPRSDASGEDGRR